MMVELETKPFRPLLAATATEDTIKTPCIISPKLDGIRCLGFDNKAMSRSLKGIPNRYVQSIFASGLFNGLDGELIVGPPNAPDVYRRTNSAVMSVEGEPDFTYYVFDRTDMPGYRFDERYARLRGFVAPRTKVLIHVEAKTLRDVLATEQLWLGDGYEGVMGRSPGGLYKLGRATMTEGILWKLKRFADAEYEIVGFVERMHNANEATKDALGHTVRSSHQENKMGRGDLGALVLMSDAGPFNCGTGFTDEERAHIWNNKEHYLGKFAKVKSFLIGKKTLPRFPVWLGLRHEGDM